MYFAYFGLSEAPFSIAPDPAYLFMSDRHREALAHLSYGLGDNGGFVLLTGEVGTGKTTISRSVMEKLPENTQAAFILNPTLSCEELLATICDNLKVRYKKTGATLKYLTDKIQEKLLKNHQNNINTLLIIDEAQHLQPQVLEQLRLLTNLETNTKKLLQVILIGQPELQQLLQRRDLRQLAQRITARYHLLPLTKDELSQYIQHRLSVAQCTRALFNQGAIKQLHKVSKGIPRVINLLCDRALILAYGQNASVVNAAIVRKAAEEALGDEYQDKSFILSPVFYGILAGLLLPLIIAGGYWLGYSLYASNSHDDLAQLDIDKPLPSVAAKQALSQPESPKEGQQLKAEQSQKAQPQEISEQLTPSRSTDNIKLAKQANEQVREIEQQPSIVGYQPEKLIKKNDTEFELVANEEVSEDLLERFKAAVNETKQADNNTAFSADSDSNITDDEIKPIHQMSPSLQNQLPRLQFEMHIYATEGQAWVRVNGTDRFEGDMIAQGVMLAAILPQQVVLEFENQRFTMPALSSW